MDRREKALNKIKKLLALSQSSNPNEAAIALKHAQKLMKEYQLHECEIEMKESANEKAFAKKSPQYIHALVAVIEEVFGVRCFFRAVGFPVKCNAVFFGQNERPEIASYCFDVLLRQLNNARKGFNASLNGRLKRSTRISRADSFCEGWVLGVYKSVKTFAFPLTEQESSQLDQYFSMLKNKFSFKSSDVREIGSTRERNGDESKWRGYQQGKQVKINHGVNGVSQAKLTQSKEALCNP